MTNFRTTAVLLGLAAASVATPALAGIETFDTMPGGFVDDRYAPNLFMAPVDFNGENVLQVGIREADSAANRPANRSGLFYDTQGRKKTLASNRVSELSIDLFVDSSWATGPSRRIAGLWGVGRNEGSAISSYGIVEYFNDGTSGQFRGYNVIDGTWFNIGTAGDVVLDAFNTIRMTLSGSDLTYTVGGASVSQNANGTARFGEVIIQGHNYGVDYDFYADNLTDVPEPAMLGLFGLGALGLGLSRRRKA